MLADELTEVAPVAAVLDAYVRVERELRRLVESLPDAQTQRMSGRQLADLAHRHGLITDETLNALNGLTVLRNLAAHAHPDRDNLDTARALDYLHLADAVLYALRNQIPPR